MHEIIVEGGKFIASVVIMNVTSTMQSVISSKAVLIHIIRTPGSVENRLRVWIMYDLAVLLCEVRRYFDGYEAQRSFG